MGSPHEMLWGALRDKDVEEPGRPEIWRRDSRTPDETEGKMTAQCDIMVITHDEGSCASSPRVSPLNVQPKVSEGDKISPEVSPSCSHMDPWRAGADEDEAENAPDSDDEASVASRGSWDD